MTLCAGLCCYEGRGGLCSVRLSQPLLKFRPRRDLVETLLHEMIHAYLFVTHNNKDHNAHGPEFLKHMKRLNNITGAKITVYHSFHDEVDYHRKHWWRCNGPCQKWPPFYGLVKRAVNRAPSSKDYWWAKHQANCGGSFIKCSGDQKEAKKPALKRKVEKNASNDGKIGSKDIRKFFSPTSSMAEKNKDFKIKNMTDNLPNIHTLPSVSYDAYHNDSSNNSVLGGAADLANVRTISTVEQKREKVIPFSGKGYVLGVSASSKVNGLSYMTKNTLPGKQVEKHKGFGEKTAPAGNKIDGQKNLSEFFPSTPENSRKLLRNYKRVIFDSDSEDEQFLNHRNKNDKGSATDILKFKSTDNSNASNTDQQIKNTVSCPVCELQVPENTINDHLDKCLNGT